MTKLTIGLTSRKSNIPCCKPAQSVCAPKNPVHVLLPDVDNSVRRVARVSNTVGMKATILVSNDRGCLRNVL